MGELYKFQEKYSEESNIYLYFNNIREDVAN